MASERTEKIKEDISVLRFAEMLGQFPLSFPKRESREAAFFMAGAAKGMLYYNTTRLYSVLRKEAYV